MQSRIKNVMGLGLLTLAAAAGPADAQTLYADSVAGFSGSQDVAGWQYGFYNGNGPTPWTPADFELLTAFDNGAGPVWFRTLGVGGYWTAINAVAGHPNSAQAIGGRNQEENWAVRRWLSSTAGLARITGSVADVAAQGGDGVTCKIFVNGVPVWTHDLDDGDTVGAAFDLSVCLAEGSPVDFALTPRGATELSDGTYFRAQVMSIVTEAPESQYACDSQPASFVAGVEGPGAYTFQWRRNGLPLAGQTGPVLVLESPMAEDAGQYDCVISDTCGSTTTPAAWLSVCGADLNCDSVVDFVDYIEFLNRFDAFDLRADFFPDGVIDFVDFLEFLNLFDAGCGGQ